MAQLVVEQLSLSYDQPGAGASFLALQDINLSIENGEFVTVVGPSGCGKSTLLLLIAALLRPSSGSIRLNGRAVTSPGADRALVFQDFALLPWRTVLKNVELGLELKKVPAARRTEIAYQYLGLVNLQAFAQHYPHQLSGGMRQRVGIARALSVSPEILLMDEPFGALDAQIRQVMGSELLRIWERDRKTIIFVTHDIDEAIYLADRVIVMSASPGRVIREILITMPRPRGLSLRNGVEFAGHRQMIWDLLEQQVRAVGSWDRTDDMTSAEG
jgi:NitT/TauT family transport system ATP-binding protein